MAKIDVESLKIRQDTSEEKFYINMKGRAETYLQYRLHSDQDPKVVEVVKTKIPEVLQGIGIEGELAYQTMLFADKNDYRILPSCPTFNGHFSKHPEFHHLRAK